MILVIFSNLFLFNIQDCDFVPPKKQEPVIAKAESPIKKSKKERKAELQEPALLNQSIGPIVQILQERLQPKKQSTPPKEEPLPVVDPDDPTVKKKQIDQDLSELSKTFQMLKSTISGLQEKIQP